MSMMSLSFLIGFLPVVFIVYWLAVRCVRVQNLILLIASLIFYALFDVKAVLVLIACIALTYFCGRSTKRTVIKAGLILNLGLLVFFKYTNFILSNLHLNSVSILLPIGLSFYVFQSSSYLLDRLNGKQEIETDFLSYALFVSFFPVITSGPIQRSRLFLPKVKEKKQLSFESFVGGIVIFLWGVFLKLVIADRISLYTGPIFDSLSEYRGLTVLLAIALYSFQIYTDFSGYSYMACAVSRWFGYSLSENFHQPYFALSIADFWRRWHISLTTWFRDYVYIPLGGNRKGNLRKYLNILIVFLISGIWHGASNHFIVWGLIHGLYQLIGGVTLNVRMKVTDSLRIRRDSRAFRLWQRFVVFVLVSIAWVFFRAYSISQAMNILKAALSWNGWYLALEPIGFSWLELCLTILFLGVLLSVSILREHTHDVAAVTRKPWQTIAVIILLFFTIVIFGIYGPSYSASNFIYEGF